MTSVHGMGRYFASYQRRKINRNLATNASIYNGDFPIRYDDVIVAQKLCK